MTKPPIQTQQVVKELVNATPPATLQSKTRLGQTPLYLASYWVGRSLFRLSAVLLVLVFLGVF